MREVPRSSGAATFLGLAIIGALVVGGAGFVIAVLATVNGPDYMGAGLGLVASAIGFGLVAMAVSRA